MRVREFYRYFYAVYNRLIGRSFVPNGRHHIYIEPTGVCNLKCVFCAYELKDTPKVSGGISDFKYKVDEAVRAGFSSIGLTPITGEIFMDNKIFDKFEYLESCAGVTEYSFYTNGILLDDKKIDKLCALEKLDSMTVSVYGHDLRSFSDLTMGGEKEYQRLVRNLGLIFKKSLHDKVSIKIGLRTNYQGLSLLNRKIEYIKCRSDLIDILQYIEGKYKVKIYMTYDYNNWGGMIKDEDVKEKGIRLTSKTVRKVGPCALIFYKNQIMVDGTVNACACRDVNATLRIGNVFDDDLSNMLSLENDKFEKLIKRQESGDFNEVCRSCDFYMSIYLKHKIYDSVGVRLSRIEDCCSGRR